MKRIKAGAIVTMMENPLASGDSAEINKPSNAMDIFYSMLLISEKIWLIDKADLTISGLSMNKTGPLPAVVCSYLSVGEKARFSGSEI